MTDAQRKYTNPMVLLYLDALNMIYAPKQNYTYQVGNLKRKRKRDAFQTKQRSLSQKNKL